MADWTSIHGSQELAWVEGLGEACRWGYALGLRHVFRMIWLEVRNRDLVPFPRPWGMGTHVVPGTGSVCSKPRCRGLCSYGCVLGIREGLSSHWLGR